MTLAAFGLVTLWFAYYIYGELAAMEATGGSMRINALFALIYRLIGKWGVTLVFVALSGLSSGARSRLASPGNSRNKER